MSRSAKAKNWEKRTVSNLKSAKHEKHKVISY